jgi:hypothetical protein
VIDERLYPIFWQLETALEEVKRDSVELWSRLARQTVGIGTDRATMPTYFNNPDEKGRLVHLHKVADVTGENT